MLLCYPFWQLPLAGLSLGAPGLFNDGIGIYLCNSTKLGQYSGTPLHRALHLCWGHAPAHLFICDKSTCPYANT